MLTALNRYVFRSHISEAKFRQIVRLFALDLEATKVAQLTHVSRRTINHFFQAFRIRMARECEHHAPVRGTVEVDESYFGRRRIRGKRGRGAGGKTVATLAGSYVLVYQRRRDGALKITYDIFTLDDKGR